MPKKGSYKDLAGQKFGRLTVIRFVGLIGIRKRVAWWECQCECGNIIEVRGGSLSCGVTKSCGCLAKESLSKISRTSAIERGKKLVKDLSNLRFGRLIALYPHGKSLGGNVVWMCQCDCGEMADVVSHSLLEGSTKSCGCLRKELSSVRAKANITHGASKTREYKRFQEIRRRELEEFFDSGWTFAMTFAIRECFPNCVVCGMTEKENLSRFSRHLSIDHVYPLSKGNQLVPGNAVVLCSHCNSVKKDREIKDLPEDMAEKILYATEDFATYWEEVKDKTFYLGKGWV